MDRSTVQDALTHLSALGFEYEDEILLGLYAKPEKKLGAKKGKGKMPLLPLDIITKAEEEGRSIYFCPNRHYRNEDVKECQVLFYEHDDIPKDESLNIWQKHGLPTPTLQVDTGGKSIHTYYVLAEPCSPEQWKTIQQGFIYHLHSDKCLVNPGRVMRLAGSIHPETGEVAKVVSCSNARYDIDIFLELMAIPTTQKISQPKDDIADAIEYLKHMGASVVDKYDSWYKVGMALKAVSPTLFHEWVKWSGQSSKATYADFEYKWDSFNGSGIDIGTLWYYAYTFGTWKGPKPRTKFSELIPEDSSAPTAFKKCVDSVSDFLGNRLQYNVLSGDYILDKEVKTVSEIMGYVEYNHTPLPRYKEKMVIDLIAKQKPYRPIFDYIKSCEPRPNIFHTNVASKYWNGTKQEDEYMSLFLRAAILRQLPHGDPVVFPFVLVLIGDSGCGKSGTFEILFKEWVHSMSGFHDPHQGIGLAKNWLCLWDEMLPVLNAKNRDKVNEFVTKAHITQNVMYGEKHKQSPCSYVIGGTTTDYQFLSDSYSQRRWMVCKIPVGTRVDLPQLKVDSDAIWASAYNNVCKSSDLGSFDKLIQITTQENKQYVNTSDYHGAIVNSIDAFLETKKVNTIYIPDFVDFMWGLKIIPNDFTSQVKSVLTLQGYKSHKCKSGIYRDKRIWSKD